MSTCKLCGKIPDECQCVTAAGRSSEAMTRTRAAFERWMVEAKKCVIGSHDPYPAGIERDMWECWQAALRAQLAEKDAALRSRPERRTLREERQ